MTTSAHTVAVAIRARITGIDPGRLHNLLYFAQGHHRAAFEDALFAEPIYAVPGGAEVDGLGDETPAELDVEQLNTVGEVVARYGRLSAAELRTLVWAGDPWKLAASRTEDPRIERAWLQDWFRRVEADGPHLGRDQLVRLSERIPNRPDGPGVVDTREAILARLEAARRRAESAS